MLAISGGMGTPNFLSTVPYLKQRDVPAIAPNAPSTQIGGTDTPSIFSATVDYEKQFTGLATYVFKDQPAPKRIALVGVAGDIGDSAKVGIEAAVGDNSEILYVPEKPGTTDFGPIAAQLRRFDADWMFLIMTNADTGGLLKRRSGSATSRAPRRGPA
ncbi:Branched chain amino acid ABC transporter periplasmic ligand-binding protein (fragment) [Aeromicrobium sp. 9AM]